MGNHFFNFKQFTVYQDQCAMKVCTDACLFGSWVTNYIADNYLSAILDIGAGTGLLSLMIAQQSVHSIEAIEIEAAAAHQATNNFNQSPWSNQLKLIHGDVQDLFLKKEIQYDFIISNPPFFEHDLPSNNSNKNLALHSKALTLKELINSIENLLSSTGEFAILIPYVRFEYLVEIAQSKGYHLKKVTHVKQTTHHSFFRSMLIFSRKACLPEINEMSIKENNMYSTEFRQLLSSYYLQF